ncbi:MAG TPA: S-methyl-5'-thioinosine phosphorylase [Burkholderiales bacterium]|nr:S-methyl-5'-thioinosine phosphorylase [Burkholderiales bacterium]
MLAIIGGSGLNQLSMATSGRNAVRTPYGEPSGPLVFGRIGRRDIVFLARHGEGHRFAPHEVNYRANLWALKDAGAAEVLSIATVGGIRATFTPGTLALPDQIIDYTWGRHATYHEGPGAEVNHIDFTEPYSHALRSRVREAARACGEKLVDGGVYATTQGPRLETAAEINRLEHDGADIVGMTAMPEAALAREISLEYAAIAVVANYAAGRGDAKRAVPLDKIAAVLEEAMGRVRRIIERLCA